MKNQPSFSEVKSRLIYESYKPMRLIKIKCEDGSHKQYVDLKRLHKINILQKESTLLKFKVAKSSARAGKYQGNNLLKYTEGATVQICCPYSSQMAYGFVVQKEYDFESFSKMEIGLLDLCNLDKNCISEFPEGKRTFPERFWKFISDESIKYSKQKQFDTEEDLCELEFEHENTQMQMKQIAYCTHDFNSQNNEHPLEFDGFDYDNWAESSHKVLIPFLSCSFNDIIITKRVPDEHGWLEGYRANDPEMSIKLIHKDFIRFMQI